MNLPINVSKVNEIQGTAGSALPPAPKWTPSKKLGGEGLPEAAEVL